MEVLKTSKVTGDLVTWSQTFGEQSTFLFQIGHKEKHCIIYFTALRVTTPYTYKANVVKRRINYMNSLLVIQCRRLRLQFTYVLKSGIYDTV